MDLPLREETTAGDSQILVEHLPHCIGTAGGVKESWRLMQLKRQGIMGFYATARIPLVNRAFSCRKIAAFSLGGALIEPEFPDAVDDRDDCLNWKWKHEESQVLSKFRELNRLGYQIFIFDTTIPVSDSQLVRLKGHHDSPINHVMEVWRAKISHVLATLWNNSRGVPIQFRAATGMQPIFDSTITYSESDAFKKVVEWDWEMCSRLIQNGMDRESSFYVGDMMNQAVADQAKAVNCDLESAQGAGLRCFDATKFFSQPHFDTELLTDFAKTEVIIEDNLSKRQQKIYDMPRFILSSLQ